MPHTSLLYPGRINDGTRAMVWPKQTEGLQHWVWYYVLARTLQCMVSYIHTYIHTVWFYILYIWLQVHIQATNRVSCRYL
jgi:hypothetical protein